MQLSLQSLWSSGPNLWARPLSTSRKSSSLGLRGEAAKKRANKVMDGPGSVLSLDNFIRQRLDVLDPEAASLPFLMDRGLLTDRLLGRCEIKLPCQSKARED